ncbi:MAG: hypothetical protein QM739_16715 [Propionivibrio sp.]
MNARLSREVIDLLNEETTTKILATIDGEGLPHAVIRGELHAGEDGNLHLPELLESSATNRNLLRSLWFDRKVSVTLHGADGRTIEIKGRPIKTHISGPLFLQHYRKVQQQHGDVDLAAVWIIAPDDVQETSFAILKSRQDAERRTFVHLNRLLK